MTIQRRQFLAGASGAVLMGTTGLARAQTASLSVPWMGWPDEQVAPLMDAFEEASGIGIEYERLPITELFNTLEVRLSARNGLPDAYLVDGPLTASYAARGHLMALDGLMEGELGRYVPSTLVQGSYDDTLYALPLGTSSQVLFYNKAHFAEAGLAEPSADPADRMTWEALLELATALTGKAGEFGFAFENTNPYQLLPLPQSWGAEVIGPDGLTATGYVDSQGFIDAMTWYQELFTRHKVAPAGTFEGGIMQEMFGSGQVSMMVGGTWNLEGLKRFADLDFGVVPHPYFASGKPVTATGSWHLGINPRSANLEAAKAFATWLSTPQAMDLFFSLRQYPPALEQIWEERAGTTFVDPAWEIVQYELANTATPRPITPGYREYEEFLRGAMRDIQGGADVAESLARAAASIDREMRKYR
ncbi:sugar ABC transporter substrate-binding protein [Poseidonocella sp. HB161398]|uniref:sugar ABC transporter substrate-binding protein n=1 Tax=Poseidonocella sp. HB161398 TaxID=2320855 RepID=UPI0014875ACA|nr:sugar ABC transporter substrate-binding protein [Poseidonocella sp. HB161398]